ncbi:OmpA family protein [Rhodocaloribacter litoris]|uniref:OmpA family protein n=1 Tax=Rhodocaloribacter litoris TaxID=2558931 RepID=UPI001E658DD3|nr:OmpA family protein [Rhodocaloribacter litoris]QXD16858.1 OmpA family protein [Rhodocaloribacter litoris]
MRHPLRLFLLIGLTLTAAGSVPAHARIQAQGTDTTTAGLPATARQPVQIRIAPEGGVRIRSRNISRPRLLLVRTPRTAPVRVITVPVPAGEAGLTARDLQQLENRLLRHLDARLAQWMALQNRETAGVSPPPAGEAPPVSGETPPGPPAVPRPPVSPPPRPETPIDPAALPRAQVTVEQISRALLDEGLFRALSIHFEVNQSTLLPASHQTLDALGTVLTRHPGLRLEIAGHTDSTGPDDYNLRLSQQRAEAVRTYLIERFGIAPERLLARGYGETRPLADNDTPTGRTLNRRVEFRVVE